MNATESAIKERRVSRFSNSDRVLSHSLSLRWQLKSGPKTKTKTFYQDIPSLSIVNATKVKTTIIRQRSSLTESLSSSVESGAVAALSVKSRVETINFV